jgi:protease secretion system outer membrane protein
MRRVFLFSPRSWILVFAMGLAPYLHLHAESLDGFYSMAKQRDATYLAAKAQRDADLNFRAIGRAGLLPSVNLSLSSGRAEYSRQDVGSAIDRSYTYAPKTWTLQISQTLFSAERLASATEGDLRALRAEAVFGDAGNELAQRLTRVWFNLLLDNAQIALAQAQQQSYASQKELAQRLRLAGVATLTDVEETSARLELASADLIAAQAAAKTHRLELLRIVGKDAAIPAGELNLDALDAMSLDPDVEAWLRDAREQSSAVLVQKITYQLAKAQLAKTRGGYLPTISLVASQQGAQTSSYAVTQERTGQLGVQLSMNLFDGGGLTAQVRQATSLVVKAEADLLAQQEDAALRASDAYTSFGASRERIIALGRAKAAATTTLLGVEMGQKAGLRSNSDVINAKQQLFAVTRDLVKERFVALQKYLELNLLAGRDATLVVDAVSRVIVVGP